jgi:uncharacterized membrane protein YcaP (DUF421 family)
MLSLGNSLLVVSVHTLVIYLFLIAGLRILGRRQLAQLNEVDLLVIVVLGSAVETAMIAGDTSLPAGLVSAGTLLLANRLFTGALTRSRRLRHLVVGGPMLLIHDGHLLEEQLWRAGLSEADVLEAIRERGHAGVDGVKFAVLEMDGTINVVPMEAKTSRGKHSLRPGRRSPAPP